jgi:hypothetical protein
MQGMDPISQRHNALGQITPQMMNQLGINPNMASQRTASNGPQFSQRHNARQFYQNPALINGGGDYNQQAYGMTGLRGGYMRPPVFQGARMRYPTPPTPAQGGGESSGGVFDTAIKLDPISSYVFDFF